MEYVDARSYIHTDTAHQCIIVTVEGDLFLSHVLIFSLTLVSSFFPIEYLSTQKAIIKSMRKQISYLVVVAFALELAQRFRVSL